MREQSQKIGGLKYTTLIPTGAAILWHGFIGTREKDLFHPLSKPLFSKSTKSKHGLTVLPLLFKRTSVVRGGLDTAMDAFRR